MQQEDFAQQWDMPTSAEPGAIVPTDWHSSFEQLRAASQAQTLQLRPVPPPQYPVHQPAAPPPPVYHAPSYGPPTYQPPQYHAPSYQAPRYGNYAPEFKPTIIVHTNASSTQDNEHGGRWVFFVLAWFIVLPVVLTLAGGE